MHLQPNAVLKSIMKTVIMTHLHVWGPVCVRVFVCGQTQLPERPWS